MELKNVVNKGTLLFGSMFVLAACGANNTATDSKDEATTVATTKAMDETTEKMDETTEKMDETTKEMMDETTEEKMDETTEEKMDETTEEKMDETTEEKMDETTEEKMDETTEEKMDETTEEKMDETTEEKMDETTEAMDEMEGLKDGKYTVVGNPDERGWAVKHTIEVKDGKITSSDFDYYNEAGDRKTEDEEYNKKMEEKSGISSKDAIAKLNDALVESQKSDVEVVSGATHTAENFVKSAAALIAKAEKGDTEESNFEEMALMDGEYKLESNADERGWAHSFTIVVKDGKVTESKYDMVDKDGKLKSENEEYNKAMKDKTGSSFAEAVEAYNKGLVEKQNVSDVEAVSGATSTHDSFVEYAKLLLEAAAKGETETIKVEVK
ncbi:FMN-binding protein [Tuanshanicoccus lijuaniae]|uniref:FMN-binding protein n=1 Tax=Aerococcaceae bacterium zg-1292 TaxID=2774330 RepID=UPI001937E663|nr:FMN-binding protein [Aerococcaceae bacterium zg-1292]QQA37807.1 FMN-binding protein [Aerococcaceae bacterium zg-1292]